MAIDAASILAMAPSHMSLLSTFDHTNPFSNPGDQYSDASPSDSVTAPLYGYYLCQLGYGPSRLDIFLASPMLLYAHERQFATAQLWYGGPGCNAGFTATHTKAISDYLTTVDKTFAKPSIDPWSVLAFTSPAGTELPSSAMTRRFTASPSTSPPLRPSWPAMHQSSDMSSRDRNSPSPSARFRSLPRVRADNEHDTEPCSFSRPATLTHALPSPRSTLSSPSIPTLTDVPTASFFRHPSNRADTLSVDSDLSGYASRESNDESIQSDEYQVNRNISISLPRASYHPAAVMALMRPRPASAPRIGYTPAKGGPPRVQKEILMHSAAKRFSQGHPTALDRVRMEKDIRARSPPSRARSGSNASDERKRKRVRFGGGPRDHERRPW